MAHVINASPVVRAVVGRDESEPHELGEELPRLLAKDDARESRILTHDADAGVARDKDQKPSLAVGESAFGNRVNRVLQVHRSSSSARRGSGLRPPLFPVLAVTVSP